MNNSIEKTLHDYLKLIGITIPKSFLFDLIKSHPDYPSMLCITETLDLLAIPSSCLEINPQDVFEIPKPFLALLSDDNAKNKIFSSEKEIKENLISKKWDGIILFAEKPKAELNMSAEIKK